MGPENGADNAMRFRGMQAADVQVRRLFPARGLTRRAGRVTLFSMGARNRDDSDKKAADERSARLAAALRENLRRRKAQERSRGGQRRTENGDGTEGSEG
jgi:hypothetical protein